MERYTFQEMADMHMVYGAANGNGRGASRLYADRFPGRQQPHHTTFAAVHRRLSENRTLRPNMANAGRERSVRTPELEEDILEMVDNNPTTSTRRMASELGTDHMTVWRVLHEQLLYPFHVQKVQALNPNDYPRRYEFCQWVINQLAVNPALSSTILYTDEACFTRDGIFNSHNLHHWAEENPHATSSRAHQQRFSINVWCGIVGDHLIGPHVLPGRLNGLAYRAVLEHDLLPLLEDVPLNIRRQLWFMHDGAPAHFSLVARTYLDIAFPNRWIGNGGPVPWPARTPDLNPLDFFLWGHLKSLVYETPVQRREELLPRIQGACQTIRNTPGMLERVEQSFVRRCGLCHRVGGRNFEQFL